MLKIKRAMLNREATSEAGRGSCAWVEIDNFGGETPLNSYCLKIQAQNGEMIIIWSGTEPDTAGGNTPLRFTDGTATANNIPKGEPRQIIEVPGLNLRPSLGGKLVLFDGGFEVDSVSMPANLPPDVRLYRAGENMTVPDTRSYHP